MIHVVRPACLPSRASLANFSLRDEYLTLLYLLADSLYALNNWSISGLGGSGIHLLLIACQEKQNTHRQFRINNFYPAFQGLDECSMDLF
jgi:hypothetical protein